LEGTDNERSDLRILKPMRAGIGAVEYRVSLAEFFVG
jgi:hypothetical protein